MKLSQIENEKVQKQKKEQKEKEIATESLENADFIKDILGEVSGGNVNDKDVKQVLSSVKGEEKKKEEKKEEKKENAS